MQVVPSVEQVRTRLLKLRATAANARRLRDIPAYDRALAMLDEGALSRLSWQDGRWVFAASVAPAKPGALAVYHPTAETCDCPKATRGHVRCYHTAIIEAVAEREEPPAELPAPTLVAPPRSAARPSVASRFSQEKTAQEEMDELFPPKIA